MNHRMDSGHVNIGFSASEEFDGSIHFDTQHYDEIDLGVKETSGHDLGRAAEGSDGRDGPADKQRSNADEDSEARCGWCFFRPLFLQRFRTAKWVLFWLCWAGAVQGMVVNGFVNVVITTIERRFGLRSSQSGLVAGGYDIASFLCLIPVTYLGGRPGASKPRWLGWGILVMGIGSLIFTFPHFAVGPYRGATHHASTCNVITNSSSATGECADSQQGAEHHASYMWLFLLGQLLHGAGASPLYTLGVTFIDENVSKKMSSVYLGIYYTTAIVGPALGYVLGGQLLAVYTDYLSVDPTELGLTPNSNVWVGAWWIGFLLAAIMCTILAVPLLAFPPALPGAAALRAERVSEAHGNSKTEAFTKIRELPRALGSLIVNPTFFFLNLAGASEGLLIAGFAAFLPKLIENQFSVNASWAALLMGLVTVPAGGGGTFLGGYLVKRLSLHCAGIIKFCVVATLIGVTFTTCFFLSCPNLAFAGVTKPYRNSSSSRYSLDSSCNADCGCSRTQFDPICGLDDVMYYSPCYAGCTQEISLRDTKVYTNCACVNSTDGNLTKFLEEAEGESALVHNFGSYQAMNQMCESQCPYLWPFVVLVFLTMFFTFLSTMPALSATLRCVQDDQRAFALGIQWIKVRLIGTIPAPMVFGALIDETCILWQESCHEDENGACLVYDNEYMSRYMLALAFIGKAASLLFFFLAWWFYIPPSGFKEALQAATPTSPDLTDDGASSMPSILMNGHANHVTTISGDT
ncbi:Solute carrier organic anion transporter family member 4A1 [Cryptotermes secundus]|uniref:Solute carrier organic anion transporter family member n=1 Tax=Cryptotermes secundus TaxID=105785 RepID=A0A2J7Q6K0_9NEOP|nr:solute carrier organic anion transporter family member 4A1 isoform X2 [Cryptotermes secundus]PNF24215.1 Solute carrier organic anion transporter family member 4A1 [Cryptotermes secundus]